MSRSKRPLSILLACVVAAGLATYLLQPTPISVEVCRVSRGPMMVTVDEDGRTRVKERYLVSAPLSGLLGRIELHPGTHVDANQTVLATIEPTNPALLDARLLAEAESRVKAAEAAKQQSVAKLDASRQAHELAQHELTRAQGLVQTKAISQAEFDTAEHQERITAANLRAAEFGDRVATFELELAKAAFVRTRPNSENDGQVQRLEIRSPVSGQVFRLMQENASVVQPGQQIMEIGNTQELEIEIDVLSADAIKIQPGAKVYLEQWGGANPLQARVRVVEPSGFTKLSTLGVEEQRVNVIADFDVPVEQFAGLGDGYRVDARIVIWEEAEILKIPHGALFRHEDSWAVFLVKNNRVELRKITVGHRNNQEAEVLDGLAENEECVEYPSDKVREGVRVRRS